MRYGSECILNKEVFVLQDFFWWWVHFQVPCSAEANPMVYLARRRIWWTERNMNGKKKRREEDLIGVVWGKKVEGKNKMAQHRAKPALAELREVSGKMWYLSRVFQLRKGMTTKHFLEITIWIISILHKSSLQADYYFSDKIMVSE